MCGIYGGYWQCAEVPKTALTEAQRLLQHRGPDDCGLVISLASEGSEFRLGSIALGQVRLSIIDLSPGGHQPMHSVDGRYSIVFNGEVYNYRELRSELKAFGYAFRTDSDTEVLLIAWIHWGVSTLKKLTGMFAFVIYDRQDDSLTLVRDAFGIKPLFYSHTSEGIMFASDVPALQALRGEMPELNQQRAYDYLYHGVQDTGYDTFIQGIHHLPPAHWLRLSLREPEKVKIERWWTPSLAEISDLSFSQAAERLRELFLDSVRFHLRSDVAMGVALSGGIDSSAIACCVRYIEPNMDLHTFSYIADDGHLSEERWIDQVNSQIGAIAHKVRVGPRDIESDIQDLIRFQGEPFCTTSIYAQYRVFGAARDAGIKVMLEGQGGDELLAGYNGYPGQYMHSLFERRRWADMRRFAKQWTKWHERDRLSIWRAFIGQILPDWLFASVELMFKIHPPPNWKNKNALRHMDLLAKPVRLQHQKNAQGRRLMEVLFYAMCEGGLPSLLRYGDRNAMRFSIENRVPFLTLPLVDFVFSLPERFLIAESGETKSVFRAAMRGIVPESILNRRDKLGFETPMGNLITGLTSSMTLEQLSQHGSLVDAGRAEAHLNNCRNRPENFSAHDWRLVNFILWHHLAVNCFESSR